MNYEIFKRGQIVPKRLGEKFLHVHKKVRHQIVFGSDCIVWRDGAVLNIKPLEPSGILVMVRHLGSRHINRRMNNGTRKKEIAVLDSIHGHPFDTAAGDNP